MIVLGAIITQGKNPSPKGSEFLQSIADNHLFSGPFASGTAPSLDISNSVGSEQITLTNLNSVVFMFPNQTEIETPSFLVQAPVVLLSQLPNADPGNVGQLWNNAGTLKVSAG